VQPPPAARSCRICGEALFPEALLRYKGMPGMAQHLPGAGDLAQDRGVDLDVCQCSGCGLVQLGNEPVPYFREVIRAAGFSEEMKAFRRAQFRRFVETQDLRGRRVLEVGCGRGEYLALLQEQEVHAAGLEFSPTSVAEARGQGLEVLQGFLDGTAPRLPGGPYDAFLMLAFLEHLPDPCATLRALRENLAEAAVGLIEVPNFDMILAKDMFSEFIGDHLFYFTRETLESTLSRCGFTVLACEAVWQGYILSATVRRRRPMELGRFRDRQDHLKAELDAFIARFPSRRVAAWGAGHQALAVMALAGLGDQLRYVVDSAPFKQGRFTPATHLPIVAPEALDSDPVDAILIMAASYSDEVARILQTRHPGRFQLAILREYSLEILSPNPIGKTKP
jgi:SAM-dependent methyltransferase